MAKTYIFTPFCPVIAAYTTTPDKPFKKKGPLYKVRLDPTAEQIKQFQDEIQKLTAGFAFTIKKPKLGVSVADDGGKVTFLAESKYKPMIFDMALNKLEDPKIGAGTVARLYCEVGPYEEGVALRLCQIQIKSLIEWTSGGGGGTAAFEAGEGFTAESGSAFGASESEASGTQSGGNALDI